MGTVWLASRSDGRFEGQAALKLLNAALVGRGGEERFKREGTILARLTHPHIARLIDAGVSSTGQPYLVLEYIDGRHIDRFCDEERLSVEARIRLFLDVQAAVAHAHANLIVHRDLKPSNVLVTATGQVKLLDFSIAKLIAGRRAACGHRLTHESGSAMTPKYAAPEQVTGGAITTATDVYSLGVLLYELLTGHHPAGTTPKSPSEFVKAVTEIEPVRLSAAVQTRRVSGGDGGAGLDPRDDAGAASAASLRGDLETILSKALKKNPSERYASVAEFGDDLRRYVDHQPIAARPDTSATAPRNSSGGTGRASTAAAVATAVFVGLIGFYTVRLAAERDRARRAGREGVESQRAAHRPAHRRRSLSHARRQRADRPEPARYRRRAHRQGARRSAGSAGGDVHRHRPHLRAHGAVQAKALPLLEQALSHRPRARSDPSSVRVAQSLNDLGVLQRQLGNPAGGGAAAGREPRDREGGCSATRTRTSRSRSSSSRGC